MAKTHSLALKRNNQMPSNPELQSIISRPYSERQFVVVMPVSVYLQSVTFALSIGTKWTAQNIAFHWQGRKKDGAGVEKVHLKRR